MRTLEETIAASELWVELTHEKRAGFAGDFAEAAMAAGKQTVVEPLLARGRMLRNVGDMRMAPSDHRRRLGMGALGALAGGGAAGKGTWEATKRQEGGLSRQQLDIELQSKDEQARAQNEGRDRPAASLTALERARKLSDWAAAHPRAATALSATGGALAGGTIAMPWYQKYVAQHVKP